MTNKEIVDSAVEAYEDVRPRYQSLSETVRNILLHAIPDDCCVHSIEARAKDVSSFRRKAERFDEQDRKKLKYTEPLCQITDLAGVRVIAFFPKSLSRICDSIENEFDVKWKKDLGEERFVQGKFGYKSIHYLVKIPKKKRSGLSIKDLMI